MFNKGWHDYTFHIINWVLALTQLFIEVAEVDSGHQFVESYSSVLSEQHLFGKVSIGILFLKKSHEVNEELFVHLCADYDSEGSNGVQFFKCVSFIFLVLIKIDVVSGTFYCLFLIEFYILEVVSLDFLVFLPFLII